MNSNNTSNSNISINEVTFQYKKHKILDNVSLKIEKGSCNGIIGANGCGKSTFLSILSGARYASTGTLIIDNKTYSLKSKKRPASIGYVPQENPLIDTLSGYENIFLWFRGSKKMFDEALHSPMIDMLGIQNYLNKEVRRLSGGMKKRLSLAIGLINNPEVLILDEPSAALDIPCKWDIYNYLKTYLKNGGTILLTTHEPEELDLCNHLFVIKDMKISEISPSLRGEELIKHF